MLRIKRTYEPAARGDGRRILVERLWPRGLTKEAVAADAWMKEVAPSTKLRQWYGHEVERWVEFRRRYRRELEMNAAAWEPLVEAANRGTVTLLYSAHDELHNGAVVLLEYLEEQGAGRGSRARRRSRAKKPAAARRASRAKGSTR